jgi:octaprenyl-diphosphate synthase
MEFSEVTALFKNDLKRVEKEIRKNIQSQISLIPQISGYLMDGGGKRIRPLLVMLASQLCKGEITDRVIKHACSIEFIHAATLLHDDVVDETTIRRGRETVNTKWGSDASILLGDYLISQSILLIAYDSESKTIQAIAEAAKELVEGGIKEFTSARKLSITEEQYLDIIYKKTGSIISVSCKLGAILSNADSMAERSLVEFGKNIGMAFQLVDDVMDYDSSEELLGKPVGTDFKEGHVTLPLLYLYRNSNSSFKRDIEAFIKNDKLTDEEFYFIQDKMREGKAIDYTLDLARDYIDKAKTFLNPSMFEESEYLEAAFAVADNIIERHLATRPAFNQS